MIYKNNEWSPLWIDRFCENEETSNGEIVSYGIDGDGKLTSRIIGTCTMEAEAINSSVEIRIS